MPEKKILNIPDYKINWKTSALHNDREIMFGLVFAMVRLALMDYQLLGDDKAVFQWKGLEHVYRDKVCEFFNSDWFESILSVYFPDYDQETVCKSIKRNQKTYNISNLGGHGLNPGRAGKKSRRKKCTFTKSIEEPRKFSNSSSRTREPVLSEMTLIQMRCSKN